MIYDDTTYDDLITILKHTVVMYDGVPVYISEVTPDGKLYVRNMVSKENHLYEINDELFSFEPVKLGYINIKGHAAYLSRTPSRQYKQGLSVNTLKIQCTDAEYSGQIQEMIRKFTFEMSNTIRNIFPSIDEATKLLAQDERKSVACSRVFKINADGNLFYKEQNVGLLDFNTKVPIFSRKYSYLKQLWDIQNECV